MLIKSLPSSTENNELHKKIATFVAIIITLAIMMLGYLGDIIPLQEKLHYIQQQISSSQIQILSHNLLRKRLTDLTKRHRKLDDEYLSYHIKKFNTNTFNTNTIELTSFLKDLFTTASKSQIDIVNVMPSNPNNNESGATHVINIEISGEYQHIIKFINQLTQLKIATHMQTLNIQKNISDLPDNKLTAKISLLLYDFNYKIHPKKIAINHDPFSYDTSANPTDISKWSNTDLHLIGIIAQDNQNIGVVKDPDGFIHYLTPNDTLGINHAKISKITTDAIITENPAENIYREN